MVRVEESYIRSGASTHKMSKQEIGWCLLKSKVPSFEEQDANVPVPVSEVLNKIDVVAFFNLLKIPSPGNVEKLEEYCLIKLENDQYVINNLGVLLAAQNMSHFSGHARRGVRVICYKGSSKVQAVKDKTFERGYAIGFNEMLDYIQEQLPGSEVIRNAFRENVTIYPIVAIRAFSKCNNPSRF